VCCNLLYLSVCVLLVLGCAVAVVVLGLQCVVRLGGPCE